MWGCWLADGALGQQEFAPVAQSNNIVLNQYQLGIHWVQEELKALEGRSFDGGFEPR